MTAIASPTRIFGAGNNTGQNSFDVIFPGIDTANKPTHALASHPVLEAWGNNTLDSIAAQQGDSKVFWSTSPTYDIGSPAFLGSQLRAIPTWDTAPGADWANNTNCTGGTSYPAAGKARCLRGSTDTLPLLPGSQNLLGDNNTTMVNRASFNMCAAVHAASSVTPGHQLSYVSVRYTFIDQDPDCVVRANSNASGEPTLTGITSLDHTHMRSIFGDDPDLLSSGGDRILYHADSSSSNSTPIMQKPLTGFKYTEKIVAKTL